MDIGQSLWEVLNWPYPKFSIPVFYDVWGLVLWVLYEENMSGQEREHDTTDIAAPFPRSWVFWLCLVAACSEMTSLPIWRTGQLHITSNKTYFLTISHNNATGNMGNATVGRARGPCRFNNDTAMVLWIDSLTCSRHIFSQFSADGCSH